MQLYSHWTVPPHVDEEAAALVAGKLGLSQVTAALLVARGYKTPDAARKFLHPTEQMLSDPYLLPDMRQAVERIFRALDDGELIGVYGDYDVDGQTSTALLVRGLQALGGRLHWYIPERVSEGYGLHERAIEKLAAEGVRLLITVDCGSGAEAEVQKAAELGMDVIITDHHEADEQLPSATAFVNPKRPDCHYPFRELAGVGVAFQLMQAVWRRCGREGVSPHGFELAALGTVADVCPLVDENRGLVSKGLALINAGSMPALDALATVSGVEPTQVSATRIAFGLAPRLNAAGRVGHAELGVRLLLCDDYDAALPLAQRLDEENQLRRRLESDILEEALQKVEKDNLLRDTVIVVAGEGWHPGVIGIVASRLVERFNRPAIVIGLDGDEGTGSARSIGPFDLYAALSDCADVLVRFGGHQMAAGLTVSRADVPALRYRLNEYAVKVLAPEDLVPQTRVDAFVRLGDVTDRLGRELARFAPFGMANPTPVLAARNALVAGVRTVGKGGDHLKLTLKCPDTDTVHAAVGFGSGALSEAIVPGSHVDVAFTVQLDEWRGRPQLNLSLRALQSPLAIAERKAALAQNPARIDVKAVRPMRGDSVPVVDRRQQAASHPLARTAYLAPLADTGARIIALVGAGEDKEAFARSAAHSLHVAACIADEEGSLDDGRVIILSRISPKAVAEAGWTGHGHLVVFGLPERQTAAWAMLHAAAIASGWTIHLAYDQKGIDGTAAFLARCFPDAPTLRVVYKMLLLLSSSGRNVLPSAEMIAKRLQKDWQGLINEAGVQHSLQVFEQLGLLQATQAGLRLVPQRGRKVDVKVSPRYNTGVEVRRQFAEYSRIALKATPADLLALAVERSPLDGFTRINSRSTRLSETGS